MKKKKTHKLEEPPQAAFDLSMGTGKIGPKETPADESAIRFANVDDVRKTNEKLMRVHRKVLQKLAQ